MRDNVRFLDILVQNKYPARFVVRLYKKASCYAPNVIKCKGGSSKVR